MKKTLAIISIIAFLLIIIFSYFYLDISNIKGNNVNDNNLENTTENEQNQDNNKNIESELKDNEEIKNEEDIVEERSNAVEVSYDVFNKYFVEKNHFNNAVVLYRHNGIGFEGGCEGPNQDAGFFRSAIDVLFLIELYHQLDSMNDDRKNIVYEYATSSLNNFTYQLNLAKDCKYSWINASNRTPDDGWILLTYAKALKDLPLSEEVREAYKKQADLAAYSVGLSYQKLDRHWGPNMYENPKVNACEEGEEYATAISNNLYGVNTGALAYYGLNIWMPDNNQPNLNNYPYLEVMKNTSLYLINSQGNDVGLWKVGGKRTESCDVAIHYNVWNIMGLSWAAKGFEQTPKYQEIYQQVLLTIDKGNQALLDLHKYNGYFPERTKFDFTVTVETERPSYVLPVSFSGNQELLDLAFVDGGGYLNIAKDESGGITGEADFHRLLTGLIGAMENNLIIIM